MRFRRLLLIAVMVVLLWSAPAGAQDSYGDVIGETQTTGQVRAQSGGGVAAQPATSGGTASSAGGSLARTGQDNIGPLIQVAFVLVGAGMLLVLVARRRNQGRGRPA